jgi:pyruvate kinase
VANAILDGTDAVMLSAETAAGRYPVECVETMARIADYTEHHWAPRVPDHVTAGRSPAARSLARVSRLVAEELGCRLIVAFTESGATAELVSTYQPQAVVIAITPSAAAYRRLALWWGVLPLMTDEANTTDEMIEHGDLLLKAKGLARSGETLVMLAGKSRTTGATDMLRVHTVA